jgi:hypothetical protein
MAKRLVSYVQGQIYLFLLYVSIGIRVGVRVSVVS